MCTVLCLIFHIPIYIDSLMPAPIMSFANSQSCPIITCVTSRFVRCPYTVPGHPGHGGPEGAELGQLGAAPPPRAPSHPLPQQGLRRNSEVGTKWQQLYCRLCLTGLLIPGRVKCIVSIDFEWCQF